MLPRLDRGLFAAIAAITAALFSAALVGMSSGSGSTRTATRAESTSVDQHAFPRTLSFYKCSPEREIARRDMIIGQAYCNVARLRQLNPKGVFLLQPGLFPSGRNDKGEADYGGMHVTYGSGLWYWRKEACDNLPGGVALGCIRAFDFDYDYMHNADGSYASISATGGHRGWNLADPLGKGTRDLVAKFMAYTAKVSGLYAKGWDGVFSDNWIYGVIGRPWAYGPNLDTDRDRAVDDYETLRTRWDDGLNEVGNRIRSFLPGKLVAGNGVWYAKGFGYNGGDREGWLKAATTMMIEHADRFYNDSDDLIRMASGWLNFRDPAGLARHVLVQQSALKKDGSRLTIPAGADPNTRELMLDPDVMRSMRWGFTLALMAGAYHEIVVYGKHSTRWWYDEYDGGKGIRRRGYLGQPTTKPVQLRRGTWRRDFQHGIALNNSTAKSVTITLKKSYRHLRGFQNPKLNDGSVVTKITLPAHDGVILLNVKQKPKKK